MRKSNWLVAVLFLVPSLLSAQDIGELYLQAAILKLQHAKEYTLKVAIMMPEEKYDYKPSANGMSFREQLLHLSENLGWLSSSYLKSENNPVRKSDLKLHRKDSVTQVVTRAYDYAQFVLDHFPASQLDEKVSFFAGPMNKLQIINLLNDHQTHHRAQLLVYLRMNGLNPPPYIGW